ncbi:hypothetical protein HYW18_03400 [Candidatus Uhrbacteria bacterium]|nr:hypothetical protein [Candidatus Uhrbacteria bacterium]
MSLLAATTFTEENFASSVPAGGASWLVAAVFWFWGLVLATILVLFAFRAFMIFVGHRRQGQYAMKLFLLAVPKFRSEEETSKQVTKEQKNEAIAVAESLFASIGGIKHQHGFFAWLFGRDDHFSFEIVCHQKLIKFYIAAPVRFAELIEQQILAQYPDAHIEETEDYNLFTPTGVILGAYLQFARPVGFPIRTYKDIESDPMSAITNTFSKIEEGEGTAVQYIVRTAKPSWRDEGLAIARRIQSGMSLAEALAGKKKNERGLLDDLRTKEEVQKRQSTRDEHRLSPQEEETVKRIEEKASKSGMEVNIRIVVSAAAGARAEAILQNTVNAFSQFNIYEYGNKFERAIPHSKKRVIRKFIFRDWEGGQRVVFNTQEMASLWHPPLPWTDTPNIYWLRARRAPAPINTPIEGLFLGNNIYRGGTKPVFIKTAWPVRD